jgi:hypothetical protein
MDEGDTDSRTFSILNTGIGTLEWSISADQPWMTVSPTSGTNSGEVSVTANTAGLGPGNYSGTITIESNGGEDVDGIISFSIKGNVRAETWSIETVDSDGDVGRVPSIVLDSNDYPHISYRDYTNGDLKYAKLMP